ncbi:ATP-binding protein [Pyxidicoccus xibeiensis]|uniref:ATP-binding protein n=1 Tax=Pyxidicoccus xibeiensis TaxID=2906759 RepID=UPI0020A82C26|nr:ATP-binding protein [Pyxidicoccus xibeiensis]MCP3143978.1 MEDS domain-containing protein [Pyxidicoccus xibeiensis]
MMAPSTPYTVTDMPSSSPSPAHAEARYHVGRELLAQPARDAHVVQLYEDESFLFDVLEQYLAGGLRAGEPSVIIASEAHRQALRQRLAAAGVDVEAACATGQLTLLDARQTLSRFMVDGRPDWERFKDVVGGVLERSRAAGNGARVRAYGEMVDLLWQDGLPDAAAELEELWNDLARLHAFSLLCTYALGTFGEAGHERPFRDVCRAHTHVIPAESYSQLEDPDCRLREVTLLQQRAQALENEIERRRKVEQELLQALRTRDEFLCAAGHELKTPLTALQLQLQSLPAVALPTAGDGGKRLRERLDKAIRHTERLTTLVEGLVDVSRVSGGALRLERAEVDLARLVRDSVARAMDEATRSECQVRVVADGPVRGSWDRQRLSQVLHHLLTNAFKYGRGKPVDVHVEAAAGLARLVVKDQGIGIATEHHERIFDRFERAASSNHFGGLGLGLWMARSIIESHGGSIRVGSEPECGAVFVVELPYHPD